MIATELSSGFESSPKGLGQQHKKEAKFQRFYASISIKHEVDKLHVFCAD